MQTTHAGDKNSERIEAQKERDRAEIRKQMADAAATAGTDQNRDAIERETQLGRGAAGINTGPSDTVSADPHNPRDNRPLLRPGQDTRTSDGMGASPPRGAQPTSDRPEPFVPAVDRAMQHGGVGADNAAGRQAQQTVDEQRDARESSQRASGERDEAEKRIADRQSPGANAPKLSEEERRREDQRRDERDRERDTGKA